MKVLSQLDQCTQIPDFNNYLAYIFADGERFPTEVFADSLSIYLTLHIHVANQEGNKDVALLEYSINTLADICTSLLMIFSCLWTWDLPAREPCSYFAQIVKTVVEWILIEKILIINFKTD